MFKTKTRDSLIEIILSDDNASDLLTVHTRTELFLYYINKADLLTMNGRNKTQQAADLYLLAKKFGINGATPLISNLLDVRKTTISKRLHHARETGLLKKTRKVPTQ